MFKIGQKVRIKPYSLIDDIDCGSIYFAEDMRKYCNRTAKVIEVDEESIPHHVYIYTLDLGDGSDWAWAEHWLTSNTIEVKLDDNLFEI